MPDRDRVDRPRARARIVRGLPRVVALGVLALLVLRPALAPGSVSEQRARLPPPARCQDPIEGMWRSHRFDEQFGRWSIFTLEIHRNKGSDTELVGRIAADGWRGGPADQEPGLCGGARLYRYQVSMPAVGSYRDGEVMFRGTSWKLDADVCHNLPPSWGYNADSFTGRIDPAVQEFQSVNNDGGTAVNDPHVFRRVKCFDEEDAARPVEHPYVEPPPFFPPRAGAGC
ncbi:MAG: hypothetical protein IT373_14675 [Polyangiaceae bacterium]|nr:hypothetical protein [Polyangiaceae bacterium]